MYLRLYGKLTKQTGFAVLDADRVVKRLLLADAAVARLTKADSANRYAYTRNRFAESPNVFQKDYPWGKAELMNFKSTIVHAVAGHFVLSGQLRRDQEVSDDRVHV